jgi:hypothetical protein
MCVPLPHEQDTNSADTAYEIVCLRILDFRTGAEQLPDFRQVSFGAWLMSRLGVSLQHAAANSSSDT